MENHPELGYGIMRMPQKNGEIDWVKCQQLIDVYMKGNYCYFDTHPHYMMGQSQRIIKEYVVKQYDRERFLLADKMPYGEKAGYEDYHRIFQEELVACGVTYFDYYLLHAVSEDVYRMHERYGGFRFLAEMKEKKKARKIGFSFHDSPALLDYILDRYPEMDFVQLQINYLDWENPLIQSKACYEIARNHRKVIIVMEPVKGGRLALGEDPGDRARKALLFVKQLPGIQVILSGMSEISQIVENRLTLAEKEISQEMDVSVYQDLRKEIKKESAVPCTGCRYCIMECQKGILIPEILSLINDCETLEHHDQPIYGRIRSIYQSTVYGKGGAGECVNCGMCERRCPQKIQIRTHLRRAVSMFEKEYFYTSERNTQILISLLRAYGIKKIIASPGASNAMFVYSVQQDGFFEIYSAPDERSAAYMACGLAEESGEPVVISCTGATASRNYLPGLTEAYYRHIPVIAVTAAQPGARTGHNIPQMIDRTTLPRDIVKMSVELPFIRDDEDEWSCVIRGNQVLNEVWHRSPGPVHINLITKGSQDFSVRELPHTRVIPRIEKSQAYPKLPDGKLGIFCGSHKKWDSDLTVAVEHFCEVYGAMVICDHTSNYTGRFRCRAVFSEKKARESAFGDLDVLIHIGDVSGAYLPVRSKKVWRVHPGGEYCDTFRSLSYVFEMEEQVFFETYVRNQRESSQKERKSSWAMTEENIGERLSAMPFSNAWIAAQTAPKLPGHGVLHLGILNSLRTWNFYQMPEGVRVYANTGGFGIDGCLSTLAGASLADPGKLYFGVMGDLAFFYDMNALGNHHIGNNLRLLVVNNGCGTEFKNYNHAAHKFGQDTSLFIAAEGHYGQKSRRLLRDYAEALGFCYRSAGTKEEYLQILPEFVDPGNRGSSLIVEVFTDSKAESEALAMLNGEDPEGIRAEPFARQRDQAVSQWIPDLTGKELVLWGCGYVFSRQLANVEQYTRIRYVCDNNPAKWNKEIVPGILCISPEKLGELGDVFVVIMLENAKAAFAVAHQLQGLGIFHFDMVDRWLNYAPQIFDSQEGE